VTGDAAAFIEQSRDRLNRMLQELGDDSPAAPLAGLHEASHYPLANGGKRIRPVLVYGAAAAVGDDADPGALDRIACAVEMIHTYSLVHDDLPAMDDDDLRRGKPSVHRAYGEATAILVGDGLQATAFEILAGIQGMAAEQRGALVEVLARASGPAGMVGGQYIDIRAGDAEMSLEELRTMHLLKTGALIRASLGMGGIAAGADDEELGALDTFGEHIGLAFQVVDDILDVEGDPANTGKSRGKDSAANKPTYVKLLGLEGAREEAGRLLRLALDSLGCFGKGADPLRSIARYIVARDR